MDTGNVRSPPIGGHSRAIACYDWTIDDSILRGSRIVGRARNHDQAGCEAGWSSRFPDSGGDPRFARLDRESPGRHPVRPEDPVAFEVRDQSTQGARTWSPGPPSGLGETPRRSSGPTVCAVWSYSTGWTSRPSFFMRSIPRNFAGCATSSAATRPPIFFSTGASISD